MGDLSLRKTAARLLQKSNIRVVETVFNLPNMPANRSLKDHLNVLDSVYRFAPEVRFHPNEVNLPSSVSWYLQRTCLRRDRTLWKDAHLLGTGDVTVDSLVSQSSGGEYSGQGSEPTRFFLEITGNKAQKSATRAGNLQSAECYVHLRPAPDDLTQIDIQYWFLYPYNGFGPGHEGDWEHVTVRVNEDLEISRIFFARHAREGAWCVPGQFAVNDLGRPVVYSAKGSHASYTSAGRQVRGGLLPLPDDHTAEGGDVWNTWTVLRLVGESEQPLDGQQWIQYTGRWGEIGQPVTSGWLGTSGPYGPAFQASWDFDGLYVSVNN